MRSSGRRLTVCLEIRYVALMGVVGVLASCNAESSDISRGDAAVPGVSDSGGGSPPDAGPVEDTGIQINEFPESGKANVRYKRNERLRNDFAAALGIQATELCLELGLYSCTDLVHQISLGGVEPYRLGIHEALPFTTVTTPIAVERVALAACEKRVRRDLFGGDPQSQGPLIYANLEIGADGRLANLEGGGVTRSIETLYKRVHQRMPLEREVLHLRQLYRDLEADGAPDPARDWAVLSCFSVLTTMEALFY